jgi:hypothetical protein
MKNILLVSFSLFFVYGFAQQIHFKTSSQYLYENRVMERITWEITDSVKKIAVDRYDTKGCKIEAIEIYEGKRKLRSNVDGWKDINTRTRFSFVYDNQGRQIQQINHDFDAKNNYTMYRYDAYGNIERWITGRSFQLPKIYTVTYDSLGTAVEEKNCWTDSCESQTSQHRFMTTTSKHYIKYNKKNLVTEDLVNYMDGMSGYIYEYTFDKTGRLINKKQFYVNSYFGLDHEIPTSKDISHQILYNEWKFEYNDKGELYKEKWTEHWTEIPYIHEFTYGPFGLILEEANNDGMISYIYDEKGLVIEMIQYHLWDKERKLDKRYKFEYIYR